MVEKFWTAQQLSVSQEGLAQWSNWELKFLEHTMTDITRQFCTYNLYYYYYRLYKHKTISVILYKDLGDH